jgi:hypothetical protein
MSQMPPEEQVKLEHHLRETAKILYKYTNSDKLKDFESIETEVREQMMERVGPFIGEFFLAKGDAKEKREPEKSKVLLAKSKSAENKGENWG